jgi:putative pyruvate formate lyase activating enzyme
MKCIFCQNYPISQLGVGVEMSTEELGERLLWLERKGAHNVNFVTPTPHVPQLIGAVLSAREQGFTLPVVYNSNGYDSFEALALLEGVVDIYLPDVKYVSPRLAGDASSTHDYPGHNSAAISEMFRQVGPLSAGEDAIANKGVLLRHLVIPGKVEETGKVLAFLRKTYGAQVPVSLMGQYFPAYQAASFPGYERRLSPAEYERAVEIARRMGLHNVFLQEI